MCPWSNLPNWIWLMSVISLWSFKQAGILGGRASSLHHTDALQITATFILEKESYFLSCTNREIVLSLFDQYLQMCSTWYLSKTPHTSFETVYCACSNVSNNYINFSCLQFTFQVTLFFSFPVMRHPWICMALSDKCPGASFMNIQKVLLCGSINLYYLTKDCEIVHVAPAFNIHHLISSIITYKRW